MPRIFVSIPLPADVAREVAALVPGHPSLRLVDAALLHFTLAFIGALPEARVTEVAEAVRAAAAKAHAFEIGIDELGRFPPSGPLRVVWAGCRDPATASAIVELGAGVRAQLARRAVPFDAKPLLPHVTLARVRDGAAPADVRAVAAAISAARVPEGTRFPATAVHVMESVLGPAGPRYSSRATIELRST